MFFLRILVLISVQSLAKGVSDSLFCTHTKPNDFEVNRLQSVFTIGDKVYIRSGTEESKIWIYDIATEEVLTNPIRGPDLLPGLGIVEFVSVVTCSQCPQDVANLVVAVGREDLRSYHKFVTYRMENDGSFVKLDRVFDLPNVRFWGLRDGEERFTVDDPFYGFFPEEMVTLQRNSSSIHGFVFFPSLQIFSLKYFTEEVNNKPLRRFLYRKLVSGGAKLTDWAETNIVGQPHVLNSAFFIKDRIFAIDNDPQYMPRISHEIFAEDTNGVDLTFKVKDMNVDAREFFNCHGNWSFKPTVAPPPVTVPVDTTTTEPMTTTTTTSTTTTTTPSTTTETTESSSSTTSSTTSPVTTSETTTSGESSESTKPSTTYSSIESSADSVTDETTLWTTDWISTENSSDSTENPDFVEDDEDKDYVLFMIILAILVVIILAIVFGFICLAAYLRRQKKGNQYNTIDEDGPEDGAGQKRGIVLSGGSSTSHMSVRSGRDVNYNKEYPDMQSPSQASVRSYHDGKRSKGSQAIKDEVSPSSTSVRSNKN